MKQILIIAEYPIFLDPPTTNLCNYLLEKGIQVTVIQHGKILAKKEVQNLNAKSIFEISTFKNTWIVKLINIVFRYIYIRIILSVNKYDHVFLYMYKNVALFPIKKYINWTPIITDILGVVNIGKFDFYFRKIALKKMLHANSGWVSDEFKLQLLEEHVAKKLSNFKIIYNCPRLSYLEKFKNKSKAELRIELSNSGFNIGSSKDIIILRAGGNVKYGGIEETIIALKTIPENIKFVIIGKCENEFKNNIMQMIADFRLENQVFMYGFVEEDIYIKILLNSC
jgi:glycosyltransferase involved in cell wall biosynthesis